MKSKYDDYYEYEDEFYDPAERLASDYKIDSADYNDKYNDLYSGAKRGIIPLGVLQKWDAQGIALESPERVYELPQKYIDMDFICSMIEIHGDEYIPILNKMSPIDISVCIFNVIQNDPAIIRKFTNPTHSAMRFALTCWSGSLRILENHKEMVSDILRGYPSICASIIASDPTNISMITFPTEAIQFQAVAIDGNSIAHIHDMNLSENVKRVAIHTTPECIRYIHDLSEELLTMAVTKKPHTIQYIRDPSVNLQKIAVSAAPDTIKLIKHPEEKIQILATKKDNSLVAYIANPCRKIQEKMLKKGLSHLLKNIDTDLLLEIIDSENYGPWDFQSHLCKLPNFTDDMRVFVKMRFGDQIRL